MWPRQKLPLRSAVAFATCQAKRQNGLPIIEATRRTVTSKQPAKAPQGAAELSGHAEEQEPIPFNQVLRKLVNTKPANTTANGPVKRNASKPPKRG